MNIRLTPTGQLRWEAPEGGTASAVFGSLRKAFQADWREGLFTLAAERSLRMRRRQCATGRRWRNGI